MNILKYKNIYFLFSSLLVAASVAFLVVFKLQPSIDFVGGTLLELQLSAASATSVEELRQQYSEQYSLSSIQNVGEGRLVIKSADLPTEKQAELVSKLTEQFGEVSIVRSEVVGPTISGELLLKTVVAVVLVVSFILLYVWKQFSELAFGICAVIALFHDSLILLGSFSLFGYLWGVEVDVLFVTAMLTTLSFSIHDTVVVFDRIRELKRKYRQRAIEAIVSEAVTETLSRSINNSVTILLTLSALALLGGETIRWFVIALLIGAVVGTYSSTFLAAPLLVVWQQKFAKK